MLKKNHRLKREDFDLIFKKGRRSHSPNLLFHSLSTDSWDTLSFSVVVPKKAIKQAVKRNKAKRRVYNNLRLLLPELHKPLTGVFTVKKDFTHISASELRKEIKTLLNISK